MKQDVMTLKFDLEHNWRLDVWVFTKLLRAFWGFHALAGVKRFLQYHTYTPTAVSHCISPQLGRYTSL